MTREKYLPSFVAISWAVLTLSWGQGKIFSASVAWWPWPKVTEMGTKKFSHTHRLTMCGLKKLPTGVFHGKLKSVGRTAAAATEMDPKHLIINLWLLPHFPGANDLIQLCGNNNKKQLYA